MTHPARMSLSNAKDTAYDRLFELEVARALAAQVVIAVEYIHSKGFAHGAITRFDGKELSPCIPSHAVLPICIGEASDKLGLSEAKILLSDFGDVCSPAKKNKFISHTPQIYRAPETRFEPAQPLSFPSDIWSLACLIWEIVGESSLFEAFPPNEDNMTRQHVDALGILPPKWWKKWETRGNKFSEHGQPMNRSGYRGSYRSWEGRFEDSVQQPRRAARMQVFESAEKKALFSMLKSMLSWGSHV
ncbi:hypothetical protein BDW59DRAFT_179049 [Aspergillus cavernicola]|uniref:Protein kinase domain-containing protein n=1 Tax=Aspergillus cavernicola TaxID=176166 RepID=A0ABR4IJ63_9EURO